MTLAIISIWQKIMGNENELLLDIDAVFSEYFNEVLLINSEFRDKFTEYLEYYDKLKSEEPGIKNRNSGLNYSISEDKKIISPNMKIHDVEKKFKVKYRFIDLQTRSNRTRISLEAIFLYYVAKFDRHLEHLFRIAYKNDPKVKERFINKFVEADTNNFSGQLRTAKYELMTEDEKDEYRIDLFGKISQVYGQINFWSFLFELPSDTFQKDKYWKEVCFAYDEIRERRNSLVHRSGICDSKYLSVISSSRYGKSKQDITRRWEYLCYLCSFENIETFTYDTLDIIDEVERIPFDLASSASLKLDISWPYFSEACKNLSLLFLKVFAANFLFMAGKRYSFDDHYEHLIYLANDAHQHDFDPEIWLRLGVELRKLILDDNRLKKHKMGETDREAMSYLFLLRDLVKFELIELDDTEKSSISDKLEELFVTSADNHVKFGSCVLAGRASEAAKILEEMFIRDEIDPFTIDAFACYYRHIDDPELNPIFSKHIGEGLSDRWRGKSV
jgi:hypothetical protein